MLDRLFFFAQAIVLAAVGLAGGAAIIYMILLIPALQSQEAAAWVQAVGSVVAIIASVALVNLQHRREVERREVEKTERDINTILIATVMASELRMVLSYVAIEGATSNARLMTLCRQRLPGILQGLESLPVIDMGIWEANQVTKLKMAGGTILALLTSSEGFDVNESILSGEGLHSMVKEIEEALRATYEARAGIEAPEQ